MCTYRRISPAGSRHIHIYDEKGMRRDLRRLGMVEMKGVLGFKKFLSVW